MYLVIVINGQLHAKPVQYGELRYFSRFITSFEHPKMIHA